MAASNGKITRRITLRQWTARREAASRASAPDLDDETPLFFKLLPPEMRLHVYEEAFQGNVVDLEEKTASGAGFLFTNKQIKSEARDAFFKCSIFKADCTSTLTIRLSKYHLRYKSAIREVLLDHTKEQLKWHREWDLCDIHARINIDLAQRDAFTLAKDLKAAGLNKAEIKVKVVLSHTKKETKEAITTSPWEAYAAAVRELQAEQEGPSKGAIRRAVDYVVNQERFFDYAHVAAERCWSTSWGFDNTHTCSCPKKALTDEAAA